MMITSVMKLVYNDMFRHPTVKWAQRSDRIYITIELPDAKDGKLKLEPEGRLTFSATKGEESRYNLGARHIVYVIKKAEKKWRSRLIKWEGKPPAFIHVDWDKWIDEDDEKVEGNMSFDDRDFSVSL
ncbi:hypothetical protein K2173_009648 [Erythroxylum novogranatense]|uniref:Co-chaperone protein p23 n=1 Tax=Erythroxylum novogranatense TaxID=1862640 RepID=A0AAV8U4H4_9ROSI|nr:hypothetical protein K2173_009648 [Erythroxylum novogranatense]